MLEHGQCLHACYIGLCVRVFLSNFSKQRMDIYILETILISS